MLSEADTEEGTSLLQETTSLLSFGWSALSSTVKAAADNLNQRLAESNLPVDADEAVEEAPERDILDEAYGTVATGISKLALGAKVAAEEAKIVAASLSEKLAQQLPPPGEGGWTSYMSSLAGKVIVTLRPRSTR